MPSLPIVNALRGLFTKTETKSFTLTDWPSAFAYAPVAGGFTVSAQTALTVPPVAAAVWLISQTVGALPCKLYQRGDNGARTANPDDPAFALVHDWANEWTSASTLRAELTRDALLHDQGGFALAIRVGDDQHVAEFIRLHPSAVALKYDAVTGEPSYDWAMPTGGIRTLSWRDVLHIRHPLGMAPITLARKAIGLAMSMEEHAAQLFGAGAKPGTIIKESIVPGLSGALAEEARKAFLAAFVATHGGAKNSGKPLILPPNLDAQSNPLSSVDSQYLETRRFQLEEIARAFGVSPAMIGDLSRATWANLEESERQFLLNALRPWLDAWCAAYARVLIEPEDRSSTYIEFVTDDLLSVDFAARATAYGQYRSMGAMTANEVRAGLNLPPLPDGDTLQNPYTTTAANSNAPKDAAA